MTCLSTLHVALQIDETTAPNNQHCLPLAKGRHIGVCTYFSPAVSLPTSISAFHGKGTLSGFLVALGKALESSHYDVLHVHNPHLGALLSVARVLLGRQRIPPLVITVHNSYRVQRRVHRMMYIPAFATFDRIVCCGGAVLESLPAVLRRLAGKRACAIQNGVDLERIDRAARSSAPREFTVITAARLVAVKRLDITIRAFLESEQERSRMVLVGDGPLRLGLSRTAGGLKGGNRVQFAGLLSRDETFRQMKAADVFVSMSEGEGLPVAVLEAMACCLPVVLSDIPPHREIAAGAESIPIVPTGDVGALAREIRRFREMSTAERSAIGARCRAIVEARFGLDRMLADYDQEYTRVARAPRNATPAEGSARSSRTRIS